MKHEWEDLVPRHDEGFSEDSEEEFVEDEGYYMTTGMDPEHNCSLEEQALHYDRETDWDDHTGPLPYDRFKRDVYNLASGLFHTMFSQYPEWVTDTDKTPLMQLTDDHTWMLSFDIASS